MKNLFILLISYFLLASCGNHSEISTATVKGKVELEKNNRIEIVLYDVPPYDRSDTYVCMLDENSEFSFQIPIGKIRFGRISIGNYNYDFSLQPNDNIEIIKPKGDTIFYQGYGAEKNSFLYFAKKNGVSEQAYYAAFNKHKITPDKFLKVMNKKKEKRFELLSNYYNKGKIRNEFFDYYIKHTQFTYNHLMIMYPDYLKGNENVDLPDEYNKLNSFSNVINDSNLFSREYLSYIQYLVNRKAYRMAQADSSLSRIEATHVVLFDSLHGQTQVYALLDDIRSTFKYENRYDTLAINKFNSLNADNASKTEFTMILNKHNEKQSLLNMPLHPEFENTVLLDTANQEITFGQLMNKYKGKVVYLDIWSSWCGPCVQEMPFSKELKEKFKDKPIEFIYLSCEFSDSQNWDKVFKITQTNENHYVLKNEFRSRMLDFMEINSVPTYMLFDKEGKLTTYRAPRPSWTPLIDNSLNKLINE